jgi:crotonobetainyl-CoA:carnitine CoA-transferase CaiB-like acyl-CoA transferase
MGGVFAAFGALAVRRRVEHGGPGEHLDLSMLEAITLMQSGEWLHSQLLQVPPVSRTVEVPSIEPAKDGYVGITMVTGQQWLDFAAMVDCPELTAISSASGSGPGWPNAPSRRSSNSDSSSGCRSRRWATGPPSGTPPTRGNAGCSCAIPRAFTSPAPHG